MKRPMSLRVQLAAVPNPDYGEGRERRIKAHYVEAHSFADAAAICRRFITANDLGSGNWAGGDIRLGIALLGRVSYNGRVWQPHPTDPKGYGAPLTCSGCGVLVTDPFGAPALAANGRCAECNDESRGTL